MATAALQPIAVKLEAGIKERIKRLADTRHRTSHFLMKEAIQQYVEREEMREDFRQEAMKAWKAYQLTGQHVKFEEADAWLEQLAQGQDVEPPECHS